MAPNMNKEDVAILNQNQISPHSPTGSTTLRSIVERLEPSIINPPLIHQAGLEESPFVQEEVIEVRKTPFGNVRVVSNPKDGDQGGNNEVEGLGVTITHPHPAFIEQEKIACLSGTIRFPIKQRTRYGKAELWQDGKIIYHHSHSRCTLTITSNGSKAVLLSNTNLPLIDPILFKKLYSLASSWFMRFRQSLTIAQFLIPSNDIFAAIICQVRANAPEPDFEIHFVCHQKGIDFSQDIRVRVSRQRKRLVYNTKVGQQQNNKERDPWAWRYGSIPLVVKRDHPSKSDSHKRRMELSGSRGYPEMLSEHEFFAIQQALKMTDKVDNIFSICFDI